MILRQSSKQEATTEAILVDGHRHSSRRWLKKTPPHCRPWWPRHPYWRHDGQATPTGVVVVIPSWFGGCAPPRWPPGRADHWPGSGAALVHCHRTCVRQNGRLDRAQVSMQLMNVFSWNTNVYHYNFPSFTDLSQLKQIGKKEKTPLLTACGAAPAS
jgi:hypothetical protein